MADEPDEERYAAESERLLDKLRELARKRRMSTRSMEKSMGVGDSAFNKVLNGKITLQFRHILMICDALGVGWREFFSEIYRLEPEPAGETDQEKILFLVRIGVLTPKRAARLLADLPPASELPEED